MPRPASQEVRSEESYAQRTAPPEAASTAQLCWPSPVMPDPDASRERNHTLHVSASLASPFLARTPKSVLVGVSLATLYVVWSSTYLALRYLVDSAPALLSCGVRYALAGAVLYTGSRLAGGARPTPRAWLAAVPAGGLLFP